MGGRIHNSKGGAIAVPPFCLMIRPQPSCSNPLPRSGTLGTPAVIMSGASQYTRGFSAVRRRVTPGFATCPLIVLIVATAVSGCAGAGTDTGMLAPTLALPKMPDLSAVAAIGTGSLTADKPVGSATEIYARVARGANTCWFVGSGPGQAGPLKKDYIYHAEADAPSRGGRAEIVIHVRDVGQPNPRGAKAYRINIDPDGSDAATLKTENLKMPDSIGNAMSADVNRWAKGDQGCAGNSTVAGWGTQQAPATAAAAPPKTAVKGKKAKVASAAKAAAQKTGTPAKP